MKGNETKTVLAGEQYVEKNHPAIELRGCIDSMHARAVYTCTFARQYGYPEIVAGLEDIVRVTREIMRSDATGQPPDVQDILGLDLDEIREVSNNPQSELGISHYMPDAHADEMTALLNMLRTDVRRTERAAVAAGTGDGAMEGIQLVLNRLSGAVYILMLENRAEKEF